MNGMSYPHFGLGAAEEPERHDTLTIGRFLFGVRDVCLHIKGGHEWSLSNLSSPATFFPTPRPGPAGGS